jgi:formate dehydrogenase gamma subunit
VGIIQFAKSAWGQDVPIHIGWGLIWVFLIAGLAFLVGHAIWITMTKEEEFAGTTPANIAAQVPDKVKRHSLVARLFHWVQSAAMLTLLFTAFAPKMGYKFAWVELHWEAGLWLIAAIVFHIIHATFFMDFWAIWPDKVDIDDAMNRAKIMQGQAAPKPRRFAKYPFENKMYHMTIVLTGLTMAITGFFMMYKVRNPLFTRNPYIFGEMTWGMMYVLHGLAGVSLIALVIVHIYMALRPEKREMTMSMLVGTVSKDHYLHHHDPERWKLGADEVRAPGMGD